MDWRFPDLKSYTFSETMQNIFYYKTNNQTQFALLRSRLHFVGGVWKSINHRSFWIRVSVKLVCEKLRSHGNAKPASVFMVDQPVSVDGRPNRRNNALQIPPALCELKIIIFALFITHDAFDSAAFLAACRTRITNEPSKRLNSPRVPLQPRSQDLSSYRLGRARRDPGLSDRAEKRLRMCEISWLALAPKAWAPYQTSKKWRRF